MNAKFLDLNPEWIREPKEVKKSDDQLEVITESGRYYCDLKTESFTVE